MAAMVAGGVSAEFVLEMGERTVGPAGGRASAAVIVAGVVSEARAEEKTIDLLRFILPLTTTSMVQET